jgi:hypothetical protein
MSVIAILYIIKDYIRDVRLTLQLGNTALIGAFLEAVMPLDTKYNFNFELVDIKVNVRRLTNQLWKLIPMRENKEDWKK